MTHTRSRRLLAAFGVATLMTTLNLTAAGPARAQAAPYQDPALPARISSSTAYRFFASSSRVLAKSLICATSLRAK